jgi:hypothetical protein
MYNAKNAKKALPTLSTQDHLDQVLQNQPVLSAMLLKKGEFAASLEVCSQYHVTAHQNPFQTTCSKNMLREITNMMFDCCVQQP